MRLRNKKTGKTGNLYYGHASDLCVAWQKDDGFWEKQEYNSLAELNNDWEDAPEEDAPEELKEHWAIDQFGEPINVSGLSRSQLEKLHRLGNDFPSENATMKAIEKLKAWKRLEDKGFRFDGWEDLQAEMDIDNLMLFNRDVINTDNVIGFRMDDYHDCIKDLNTCFGG